MENGKPFLLVFVYLHFVFYHSFTPAASYSRGTFRRGNAPFEFAPCHDDVNYSYIARRADISKREVLKLTSKVFKASINKARCYSNEF